MKNNEYSPISCTFYDLLEAFATKKQLVTLVFNEMKQEKMVQSVIVTFVIENKVEYLLLQSRQKIRLDSLIEVGGHKLSDYTYC